MTNVLNIGLFHFPGPISVNHLVFVLFAPPLSFKPICHAPINFLAENVFIYLFSKFIFYPSLNNFIIVFCDIIAPDLLLKKVATITSPCLFDHNIIRCNSTEGVI